MFNSDWSARHEAECLRSEVNLEIKIHANCRDSIRDMTKFVVRQKLLWVGIQKRELYSLKVAELDEISCNNNLRSTSNITSQSIRHWHMHHDHWPNYKLSKWNLMLLFWTSDRKRRCYTQNPETLAPLLYSSVLPSFLPEATKTTSRCYDIVKAN